jgi:hypothetical protein
MTPWATGIYDTTLVMTCNGNVPVETLTVGTPIRTLHGGMRPLRWIGRQTRHGEAPVQIRPNALDDGVPSHLLSVAPGHGICIDGALIQASQLVNGATILQPPCPLPGTLFRLGLNTREIIIANNCPVESFLPDAGGAYLATIDHGFGFNATLQRLAARAALPQAEPSHGRLRGFVDIAGPLTVCGWAQCLRQPELPVCLDILAGGARILRVLANQYRDDLRRAGIGGGYHAFSADLRAGTTGRIEVRRAADQALLFVNQK